MRFKMYLALWLAPLMAAQTLSQDLPFRLFLHEDLLSLITIQSLDTTRSDYQTPGLAFTLPSSSQSGQKSKGKAFLLSLVVPGLGQYYVNGSTFSSQAFMATEAVLWTSFIGLRTYGAWREEDYQAFAATHAKANISNKDHRYFVNLGNFISIYSYNAAKLRDRNLPDYYSDIDSYFWAWDTDENRSRFYDLRIGADRAFDRAKFTVAGIFVNHVVSAIMAIWSAHQYNKKNSPACHPFNFQLYGTLQNTSARLTVTRAF